MKQLGWERNVGIACVIALMACSSEMREAMGDDCETDCDGVNTPAADDPTASAPSCEHDDSCTGGEDLDPDGPDDGGDDGDRTSSNDCDTQYETCVAETGDTIECDRARAHCKNPRDDEEPELPPASGDACCEPARNQCIEDGDESASTCAAIEDICVSGTCAALRNVCPLDEIPVSEACAEAYQRCYGFGFRVNKCQRVTYSNCMTALDDHDTCTQWRAACDTREAYCDELVGTDPHLIGSRYNCTDWGHGFDRCFVEYEACDDSPAACANELNACSSGYIYNWKHDCNDTPWDF